MQAYIIRRLLLIVPTLLGIMVVNFFLIQMAPGGPVHQMIAQLEGTDVDVTSRFTAAGNEEVGIADADEQAQAQAGNDVVSRYQGARGIPPELIREIEAQFGFDKPMYVRFFITMGNLMKFDLGDSYFRDKNVMELVVEKLPVSLSLGVWTTLLVYLISIPLGIAKAVRDGTKFDAWTSAVILVGFSVPSYLFAIMLIIVFSGGSYLDLFPLRGLVSSNWDELSWGMKILDYAWHMTLPIVAMMIGGFAGLTMLTKNSFIEEINKQFVVTARAKGLTERRVLYGHVFRNAMLIVIAGFPAAFLSIFFTGVLMIEIIFSLDGLGRMGYEATLTRDYPLIFGSLYVFTLLGLMMGIIRDLTYAAIDPRIHFDRQEVG
ncbi:MAG: microcin C ABC transporter permease YejB [Alphaproteobacteria bacterium]|jgi:microcin C transport system permease protein|nr:microcin C ABC transporter permease YejB [Alphaproteobacteria bacterium]